MNLDKQKRRAGRALLNIDHQAHELLGPYAESKAMDALHPVSKLADQPQLRMISGALLLAGLLRQDRRLARAGSRMIVAHEAATIAKDAIKTEIERTRPRSAESKDDKKPKRGKRSDKEVTSFPSGHSAGAIAAARAFSREFPEYGIAAVGGATLLALLQIVRCAHYPTDVTAGLALGLAAEKATDLAWSAATRDELSEEEEA
ncbi:MAG TPA: phosphatase PAP2 family protein [Sphingomicrobium sp.]|jgi:membrane-associated phospholipid phosphatase